MSNNYALSFCRMDLAGIYVVCDKYEFLRPRFSIVIRSLKLIVNLQD